MRDAGVLARALHAAPPRSLPALASGGSQRALLGQLAGAGPAETIVLVGHEPDLGRLAGALLFDAPGALPLKKAGACGLSFDGAPQLQRGDLDWFLSPRLLRALGSRSRAGHGAS